MANEGPNTNFIIPITLFIVGGITGFFLGNALTDDHIWEQYFQWVFAGFGAFGLMIIGTELFDSDTKK